MHFWLLLINFTCHAKMIKNVFTHSLSQALPTPGRAVSASGAFDGESVRYLRAQQKHERDVEIKLNKRINWELDDFREQQAVNATKAKVLIQTGHSMLTKKNKSPERKSSLNTGLVGVKIKRRRTKQPKEKQAKKRKRKKHNDKGKGTRRSTQDECRTQNEAKQKQAEHAKCESELSCERNDVTFTGNSLGLGDYGDSDESAHSDHE